MTDSPPPTAAHAGTLDLGGDLTVHPSRIRRDAHHR